jgi:hypothetical protein
MKRLILSILAGLLTTALLSTVTDHIFHLTGTYPPYDQPMFDTGLLLMAFTYRAVYGIFGAFLTAILAREQASKAVFILGIIGTLLWVAGTIAMWEYAAPWYNIGGILTAIPFCLVGGKLYTLRARQF